MYVKEGITYKVRNEIKITKSKELESIFIEIQNNHKRKNVIEGCIYRDLCMDPLAFENKDTYLTLSSRKRTYVRLFHFTSSYVIIFQQQWFIPFQPEYFFQFLKISYPSC